MTQQEQHDLYWQMMEDGEVEREAKIRELAEKAAAAEPAPVYYGGYRAAFMTSMDPGFASDPYGTTTFQTIRVELHPNITGFARVLIAEEIIREQIGDTCQSRRR